MEQPPSPTNRIVTVPIDTLPQPRWIIAGRISWRHIFAAFHYRNYRLFFAGQFVSLIGTWMHSVAQGWLVYDLSRSAFVLGFVTFLTTLPVTLFSLVAGAFADRHDKRLILIFAQTAAMLLAVLLAALVHWHVITVWQVAVIGLLTGIANAFDIPTRQSFVVEMVGKENLTNAIALNSSMFHAARVCGPALAGILISYIGVAGCFFLNGLSFLAVIAGYCAMRLTASPTGNRHAQSLTRATREAFRYVTGEPVLRTIMSLTILVSLLAIPYATLLPAFARDVLHSGAAGLGYLTAANGAGALLGALTLASLGEHPHQQRLFLGGLLAFCVMIVVFALSRWFWVSAAALVGVGYSMLISLATANAAVQSRSPDHLRGRIMGIYVLSFLGLAPVGSLLIGSLARVTNVRFATALGPVTCIVAALIVQRLRRPAPQQ